jgi:circadian clock protein KaiC
MYTNAPEAQSSLKNKIRPRITSGIEGLDELLTGGFQKNKCYLISGAAGTAKSIFSLQYIVSGIGAGEKGIYVTVDEKPGHLIEDAASLGWDIEAEIQQKRLVLLDTTPYFTNIRLGRAKGIDVRTLITDLTRHVRDIGATRLVIDPIAPLVFAEENTASIQEYIRELVGSLEDNLKCTTIITSGVPSGTDRIGQYGVEEFVVSGIILLGIKKVGERRLRTIQIRKMRGTDIDLSDHVFEIHHKRGIVVREVI